MSATVRNAPVAIGDVVTFEAPSGKHRYGRVTHVEWDPAYNRADRWRISVATNGTTLTVSQREVVGL